MKTNERDKKTEKYKPKIKFKINLLVN